MAILLFFVLVPFTLQIQRQSWVLFLFMFDQLIALLLLQLMLLPLLMVLLLLLFSSKARLLGHLLPELMIHAFS